MIDNEQTENNPSNLTERSTSESRKGDNESPSIDSGNSAKEILEKNPELIQNVLLAQKRVSYSGPLPPPRMLKEYDEVHPGCANTIVECFTKEQDHRIEWENKILEYGNSYRIRGQNFGFVGALVCIGCATYLATTGNSLVAAVLAGISAVGIVGHFLRPYFQKRNKQNAHSDKN